MLSKNRLPYDPQSLPPARRLRANVRDLFATNTLSGIRSQGLINDMYSAGAAGVEYSEHPVTERSGRNLRVKFMKYNQWPS